MAQEVTLKQAPELKLANVDFIFEVKNDDGIVGKLAISKGGVKWTPRNISKNVINRNWTQFDAAMKATAKTKK